MTENHKDQSQNTIRSETKIIMPYKYVTVNSPNLVLSVSIRLILWKCKTDNVVAHTSDERFQIEKSITTAPVRIIYVTLHVTRNQYTHRARVLSLSHTHKRARTNLQKIKNLKLHLSQVFSREHFTGVIKTVHVKLFYGHPRKLKFMSVHGSLAMSSVHGN